MDTSLAIVNITGINWVSTGRGGPHNRSNYFAVKNLPRNVPFRTVFEPAARQTLHFRTNLSFSALSNSISTMPRKVVAPDLRGQRLSDMYCVVGRDLTARESSDESETRRSNYQVRDCVIPRRADLGPRPDLPPGSRMLNTSDTPRAPRPSPLSEVAPLFALQRARDNEG
jgi:hypothetical protein